MTNKPVILVVEDEVFIRMAAVQTLEDAGFVVLDAGNADDALRILEVRGDISAVFTDINMPGTMDGLRLVFAVRARWPPIRGSFPLGSKICPLMAGLSASRTSLRM